MPRYSGIWTLSQVNQAIKNLDWEGVPPTGVEYLIVAGGGGSGRTGGGAGGGGAGGLLQGYTGIITGSSYTVTIGAGGTGSSNAALQGSNGANSVFGSITAIGGGGGGTGDTGSYGIGLSGGSGGGGTGYSAWPGGSGIFGQGNAGGTGVGSSLYHGGGGGGAGTVGLNGTSLAAGNGGAGVTSDITGTKVTYAGGGAGGINSASGGLGGVGGGGNTGATADSLGISGTPNTGGGGGGGYASATNQNGVAGGSGIVVVRYPGNVQYFTGGTLNYSNGYIVHTFYSSGTLAPVAPRLFASPDYQISKSLRFYTSASDTPYVHLNRTPSATGSTQRVTYSCWVKKSGLADYQHFGITAQTSAGGRDAVRFQNDEVIQCYLDEGRGANVTTPAVFRDSSAWYHIVTAIDTTQQTSTDRIKIYVNGVQVTLTGTYPVQNYNFIGYNVSGILHNIGKNTQGNFYPLNGYLAEVNFIDGQQLTAASFGYTEPSTGVWTPLKFTGSYGTNGFYLTFADNSNTTAATLGADSSGNGNNWIPNNFSVTAGTGNDSLVDTPTNYGVDTGLGGEVRGNYCTWNPVDTTSTAYLSNGNLTNSSGANNYPIRGTIGFSSGKWYWEWTEETTPNNHIGVWGTSSLTAGTYNYVGEAADSWGLSTSNGNKRNNGSNTAYGSVYANGDVGMCAVDMDSGKIWWGKNGTWFASGSPSAGTNAAFTNLTGTLRPAQIQYSAGSFNFGQRPFAYTAPTGFKALCTQNLPESTAGKLPGNYFGVATYQGTGTYNVIPTSIDAATNGGMVWLQARNSGTHQHDLIDSVRGYTKLLDLPSTGAESTYNANIAATNFGYTISDNSNQLNGSAYKYVGWNWAGGGTAVANTAGSIASSVSANFQAGFSIVTYTGNNTTGTVGHGLGATPSLIIVKRRDSATNWLVYSPVIGATQFLYLNTTAAAAAWAGFWGNTAPTSSVFTVSNDGATNASAGTYVAYCWAEVAGYSKFGSYTGNGVADGPFVYCGFRPAYIMVKRIDAAQNWFIWDKARSGYNMSNYLLFADSTQVEYTGTESQVDLLSNGFKIRAANPPSAGSNASGGTYIFAAFAESPFKYARAR